MSCKRNISGSICKITDKSGYFLNSGDNKPNSLIYCRKNVNSKIDKYKNHCQVVQKMNGYFINEIDKNVIKCVDSDCQINEIGSLCKINNNNIIIDYDTKTPYYCLNEKRYKFDDFNKYLRLTDIDPTNSTFPKINTGYEYILLKIDDYSVTQYITNSSNYNFFIILYIL